MFKHNNRLKVVRTKFYSGAGCFSTVPFKIMMLSPIKNCSHHLRIDWAKVNNRNVYQYFIKLLFK